ncbi:hypothetical protein [Lactobacillus sp. PV034]|uniref:hypothetical protein n=1 Tax=Lactobacillus sp. PV034 TaxID=2594495 RepID=UPI00223F1002|nr:hypothetical protein [Lactobacillus sp. PV034]QNQ80786.1 hypothetical protein FP432_04070 [Lactobacillus sp. PV034]
MSMFEGLKQAISLLWRDKVTVIGTKPVKHGAITNNEEVTIVEDEPAKVIVNSTKAGNQTFFDTDQYDAKLLIRNGINIPAGAVIVVTDQNGNTVRYKRSSRGYTGYYSHQELAMVRDEKA